MSLAYFDTSILVKRYIKESGSSAAARLFKRYRVLTSALAPIEMLSALTRRHTAGELSDRDYVAIRVRLVKDRAYWELMEVSVGVLRDAEELVQGTGVRSLDALHVASARTFQTITGIIIPFITADNCQGDGAELAALNVIRID